MKAERAAAAAMMNELGFPAAEKWNLARMQKKLVGLPSSLGPNDSCEEAPNAQLLEAILTALESGEEVEVVESEATAADAPAEAAPAATQEGGQPKPKAVAKKEAKAAAAKTPKPKEEKEARMNRGYAAGMAIARAIGSDAKAKLNIDELVPVVDDLFGKANKVESTFRLRSGAASIMGWVDELQRLGYTVTITPPAK